MGAVALDPGLGYYVFEYDPAFIRKGLEPAPLTMPFSKGRNPFVFTDLPEMTYKRLPAMLADALPDNFGNALIDAWMAGKGVEKDRITALDRLAYMGKRGMGALEFKPARGYHRSSVTALELSKLVESARLAVRGDIGSDPHALAAISQRDILVMADRFAVGQAGRIIGDVREALSRWPEFAETAGVRATEMENIKAYHQTEA